MLRLSGSGLPSGCHRILFFYFKVESGCFQVCLDLINASEVETDPLFLDRLKALTVVKVSFKSGVLLDGINKGQQ